MTENQIFQFHFTKNNRTFFVMFHYRMDRQKNIHQVDCFVDNQIVGTAPAEEELSTSFSLAISPFLRQFIKSIDSIDFKQAARRAGFEVKEMGSYRM